MPPVTTKRPTQRRRTVAPCVEYPALVKLASQTKRRIQWRHILRGADPTTAKWKWLENQRNFSIYTKEERSKQFAVLAIGVVKGSVPEIASLLVTTSQIEYVRKMEALYDKTFKHGMYVSDVVGDVETTTVMDAEVPPHLSVRTATIEKLGGWKTRHDEWCFLESIEYDEENQVLEKLLTTLDPQEVFADFSMDRDSVGGSRTKVLSDITAGYRIEMDTSESIDASLGMEDPRSKTPTAKTSATTRVHFYADYGAGTTSTHSPGRLKRLGRLIVPKQKQTTSNKHVRQWLMYLAKSCDRISSLVRRRRLGMQVVVDQKRFVQFGRTDCYYCDQKLGMIAKLCRICGQCVCSDCSAKYERETHARLGYGERVRLESIRVCDPCLTRIDGADYSAMSDLALAGPWIRPNPPNVKAPAADLKDLLHDALLEAPSTSRKHAVLSVILCLLDQERASCETTLMTPMDIAKSSEVLLSPVSMDQDYVDALDYLDVETVPCADIVLANEAGRPYAIDPRNPEASIMKFPVPENEVERLAAIEQFQVLGRGTFAELDIICDIAAKELGSFAGMVTIVAADEQYVIGSNKDFLRKLVLPRQETFCTHTIMSTTPLEVPHPEADIRFGHIAPVTEIGARYYCGFPLVADDAHDSVIGALCVLDTKPNAMNEAQYAVLRKLAETATKVVRLKGAKRRCNSTCSEPQ